VAKEKSKTAKQLTQEVKKLRARLAEAEETLRAIREGEADPVIASGSKGEQVFPLTGERMLFENNIKQVLSDRKQTEAALRESEQSARQRAGETEAVFAAIQDAVLIYDTGMNVVSRNPGFTRVYGFEPKGLNVRDIIARTRCRQLDGRPLLLKEQPTPRALCGERVLNQNFRITRLDGQERVLETSSAPLRNDGRITGTVTVWHDITARNLAEEEKARLLVEVERRAAELEATISSVAIGLIVYDKDGGAVRLNSFAKKLFPPKHFSGTTVEERQRIITWEKENGRPFTAAEIPVARALRGETVQNVVLGADFNDRKVWIMASAAPILTPDGKLSGAVATFIDITDQKQTVERLKESQERFRSVVASTPDHILVQDAELRYILVVNPQLGLTEKDMIGKTDHDLLSKADAARLTKIKKAVLKTGKPKYLTAPLVSSKGGTQYFEGSYTPKHDQSGRIDGLIGYFRNVTDRNRAEQELQVSRENLSKIYSSMSEGLAVNDILYDNSGKATDYLVTEVNPAFEKITGLTRSQAVGKRASLLYLAEELHLDIYARVAFTGTPEALETYSKQFNRDLNISVFSPGKGKFVAVFQDITERKRAEAARRKRAEETLRLSEQEFISLAEAMPQIVWATRPDGWNIYFNKQWTEYTGMTPEESYGHGWNKPFHPDDKQRAWDAWQRATRHNEPYSLECRLRRSDGCYHWWLIRGVPMLGANGEILKWFGTCTDIEDIKRSELELKTANDLLEQRVVERTAELLASQENLSKIYSSMSEGLALHEIVYNKAGKAVDYVIKDVNPAYVALTGIMREVVLGKRASAAYGAKKAPYLNIYSRVAATGEPASFEAYFQPLDKHFHISVFSPKTGEFATVFQDVTGRKLAAIQQQTLAQRFNTILSSMYSAVLLVNDEGKIEFANQSFCNLYALKEAPKDLVGISSADMLEKIKGLYLQPDETLAQIRATVERGEAVKGEEITMRNGTTCIRDYIPLNLNGKSYGRLWLHVNITDRKNKEEEVNKLNRVLKARSASDNAMMRAQDEEEFLNEVCRIVTKDCGHAMVWVGYAENDEARTVRPVAQAGFEAGYLETLKLTWADTRRGRGPTGTAIRTGKPSGCRNMLIDPAFKPWRAEAIKRGYASSLVLPLKVGRCVFGALTIYSKEADAFTKAETDLLCGIADDLAFGITAIRLRLENEKAEQIVRRDKNTLGKLVKERSEQLVKVQVELEKAKRLSDIGVLAATVAHELRNPLATIGMAAANIKRKAKNPDLDRHLSNIDKKVFESNQIINNLLFYSRLKPPHYERVGIFNILEECIEAAGERFTNVVDLGREIDSLRNVFIEADPIQIKEVFNNLLNNAGDAIQAGGGKIEVTGARQNSCIHIAVKDSGRGIDKETLEHVFDPFFTTKAKGTGLGLSVCRQIMDFHDGCIEIQSEPDKGTTVNILLPMKRPVGPSALP